MDGSWVPGETQDNIPVVCQAHCLSSSIGAFVMLESKSKGTLAPEGLTTTVVLSEGGLLFLRKVRANVSLRILISFLLVAEN